MHLPTRKRSFYNYIHVLFLVTCKYRFGCLLCILFAMWQRLATLLSVNLVHSHVCLCVCAPIQIEIECFVLKTQSISRQKAAAAMTTANASGASIRTLVSQRVILHSFKRLYGDTWVNQINPQI